MTNENTIIKYRSQDGDLIRVTHFYGQKRGIGTEPVWDMDGWIHDARDVGRLFPVSELRIYKNGEIVDNLPLRVLYYEKVFLEQYGKKPSESTCHSDNDWEIPSELVSTLGESLESLARSGADSEEVGDFIKTLSEEYLEQSRRARELIF